MATILLQGDLDQELKYTLAARFPSTEASAAVVVVSTVDSIQENTYTIAIDDPLLEKEAYSRGADVFISKTTATPQIVCQLIKKHLTRLKFAKRDFITGLDTREAFTQQLNALEEGAALAVLDLDWFKKINDTYGHSKGDQVLQEFAELLCQHTREADGVYRIGGEEFVIVFPNTIVDTAADIVGRIRQQLSETLLAGINVTFSAGISDDAGDLFNTSDAALYDAKHQGRNRTVIYQEALSQTG